ncbi:MAG: hypothetical protein J6B95_04975 [Oscillospiraceae bacterium]|nr:hypothetical protein [Oscillospiraceae bacterium]
MLTFEQKQHLMELLPEFLLMSDTADAAALKGIGAVEAKTAEEVLAAYEIIGNRRGIFYAVPADAELGDLLGKCRFIASSMEELAAVNEASAQQGVTTMVGLRLVADGFEGDGITTAQLQGMVHDIKQLKNISVCGSIVVGNLEGLHGKELGKFVRSSYQTAKMMTVILPCSMPYICLEGLLEAAAWNQEVHPETMEDFLTAANIVGMQNVTAFYADYYIQ